MKINLFEKLKEKKFHKYIQKLVDPIFAGELEINQIKRYFESKGYRYIGKKYLDVLSYYYKQLFILFYHSRYKFIVTTWEHGLLDQKYTLSEVAYRTKKYPVLEARKFFNSVIDRIHNNILEQQKEIQKRSINNE